MFNYFRKRVECHVDTYGFVFDSGRVLVEGEVMVVTTVGKRMGLESKVLGGLEHCRRRYVGTTTLGLYDALGDVAGIGRPSRLAKQLLIETEGHRTHPGRHIADPVFFFIFLGLFLFPEEASPPIEACASHTPAHPLPSLVGHDACVLLVLLAPGAVSTRSLPSSFSPV
jgi:hypothetical protein